MSNINYTQLAQNYTQLAQNITNSALQTLNNSGVLATNGSLNINVNVSGKSLRMLDSAPNSASASASGQIDTNALNNYIQQAQNLASSTASSGQVDTKAVNSLIQQAQNLASSSTSSSASGNVTASVNTSSINDYIKQAQAAAASAASSAGSSYSNLINNAFNAVNSILNGTSTNISNIINSSLSAYTNLLNNTNITGGANFTALINSYLNVAVKPTNIFTNLYTNSLQIAINATLVQVRAKSGVQWSTLNTKITNSVYTNPDQYKPQAELHTRVISNLASSSNIKTEFNKGLAGNSCTADYLYYCNSATSTCTCSDTGCPSTVSGTQTVAYINSGVSVDSSVNVTVSGSVSVSFVTPVTAQAVSISSYYIATGCIGGNRIIYSEMTDSTNNSFNDYMQGGYAGVGTGNTAAQQTSSCATALATGVGSKSSCRGNMNAACTSALDNTCQSTGLYSIMQTNPASTSPYPVECNDALSTYSDIGCFTWIANNLIKGTMVFDFNSFNGLSTKIQASVAGSSRRMLQSSSAYVVSNSDSTQSDSASQVNGTVNNSDMQVDGSTSQTVANPNSYVVDMNAQTSSTKVSANWIGNFSAFLFFAIYIILI